MIPDPVERAEAAAEDYVAQHYDPVTGTLPCSHCGSMVQPGDLWPSSLDPSSPPICSACLFVCDKCGKPTEVAPQLPLKAVCIECCEDHEYEYDPQERERFCKHCNARRPADWSFDD